MAPPHATQPTIAIPPDLAHLLAEPVHVLLILSIAAVTVVAWVIPPVQRGLMLIPVQVARGQVYRLLTAGWVHAGLTHLVMNLIVLYLCAGMTLQVLGDARFLLLYVTAVIAASIPSTLAHLRDPRYASLGASGGIAAIMIADIVLHPRLRFQLLFVQVPGMAFAVFYLVYSALHALRAREAVNHTAHLTGALYGALLSWAFEPARVERTVRAFFSA
jgi:membrane associated rhomboid family serine protease